MLTRRTLATTPPVATTAAAASGAVDPVHAALLRHRVTKAALGLIDEVADPVRYAAAKQYHRAADDGWGPGVGQLHDRKRR